MNREQKASEKHSGSSPSKSSNVFTPKEAAPPEQATAQQLEKVEKQMSSFEKSTLRWARAAVIMSGLAAIFVFLQWGVMQKQLRDAEDSSTTVTTQMWQAIDNVNWMARTADQSSKDTLTQMQAQSKIMQENANSVVSTNRAWIVPDSPPQHKPTIQAANLVWHNAGKTPAVAVASWKEYFIPVLPQHLRTCVEIEKEAKRQSTNLRQYQAFVGEGGKYEIGLDHAPSWPVYHLPIAIHGCIWYTDISSNTEKSSEFFYSAIQNKYGFPASEGISLFFDRPFIYK